MPRPVSLCVGFCTRPVSAAEKTRARVEMRMVYVAAPQVVPARRRIRETRGVVFADILSRCCRKVRIRSSFPPRYVGFALNCSGLPSTMTLSSRLAYRLLRWYEEVMVFAMLSFRR